MTQTYFKVVSKDLKSFLSACEKVFRRTYKDYIVQYVVGKWVKPVKSNSRLFAFNSLENVRDFLEIEGMRDTDVDIYECDVCDPQPIEYLCVTYHGSDNFDDFWSQLRSAEKPAPSGTITCSEIRLTKQIEYSEVIKYDD